MAGRARQILLGYDSKQKLPRGALWLSQNTIGLTGPPAKPRRLGSRGTVASFQPCEGSRRGCVSGLCIRISFQRKCRSTGRENITYHCSLFPEGKSPGANRRAYLPCCPGAPGVHSPRSGLRGAPRGALMILQSSLLLSGTSKPLSQLQMKCRVNKYLLLKLCSGISLPPNSEKHKLWTSYCFFIIWNETQVPLSKVLTLNSHNAYPLKYVISWK